MLNTSLLALKNPKNKIRIVALGVFIAALAGCASQPKPVTDAPSGYPQTQQPNNYPQGSVLEEVVVTSSKSSRSSRSKRKNRAASKEAQASAAEYAYGNVDESDQYAEQSDVPILREGSAQQIFRDYGVNPTMSTRNQPYSTFAMDVDTVSYQITKASLESNSLPKKSSVRVEEFINNFSYNYGSSDDVFSISAEVAPSPYRPGFHLLHVGVKAKYVADQQRLPANLVLVADVSGSMQSDHKMGLQKQALTTLVSQLSARDSVAIVTYSDQAKVLLEPTTAKNKSKIYAAIQQMHAGGGTNVEHGLQSGYALADAMAYPGHVNRVVLTSDGLANIGNVDPKDILEKIKKYRERNIFLTTVGVGKSMYNDYLLEQLANKGNGNYLYLANQADIERVFVDGLTTQLQVVAKDAKVQVKFNPEKVSLYRQIGYENRGLKTQDFLDASKDGGEVGANQQVTVLYEVKLANLNDGADIANVALSYKKPQGSSVFSLDKAIPSSVIRSGNQAASSDTVISMAVAAFAEKLRQSYWSRTYDYNQIQAQLVALPEPLRSSSEVVELQNLVAIAARLDSRRDPYSRKLPLSRIDYDRVPLLR
jgi:Ca-activated chloride channel family protein